MMGDTERIVFTMARAAPWVQDPAKDQQDFGSDTLKDWDLSRPPDPKGEHICRLQQSGDPHFDFSHQDVKRLKLAASEAPQEELLGRAGGWWGSRQPTAPTTPAQGRSEHSRALWIGMGWDERGMSHFPSLALVSLLMQLPQKPANHPKQRQRSALLLALQVLEWATPLQTSTLWNRGCQQLSQLGAQAEGDGGAQMPLERPLHSFTLPDAASCKQRVSRAGGIFTDICPKPGLQKAVTYQKTHDFGRASTPTVLGRLSQGWAEMEGGDPSSRH